MSPSTCAPHTSPSPYTTLFRSNLLVAADDRVELVLSGEIGDVAAIFLKGLVLALGVLISHALVPTDLFERGEHALVGDTETLQRLSGVALVFGHREEQVLRRHELVAEALGLLLRLLQDAPEARGRAGLP